MQPTNVILKQIKITTRVFMQKMLIVSLMVNVGFVSSILINRNAESFSLSGLFIGRLFLSAFLIYILSERMKMEFVYYSNIGLPKLKLLTLQFAIDAILSLIIFVIGYGIIR